MLLRKMLFGVKFINFEFLDIEKDVKIELVSIFVNRVSLL